jgi:hypothetical protein
MKKKGGCDGSVATFIFISQLLAWFLFTGKFLTKDSKGHYESILRNFTTVVIELLKL